MKQYHIEFAYYRPVGEHTKKGKGRPPQSLLHRVVRKNADKAITLHLSPYGGMCVARVYNRDALIGAGSSYCSMSDRFVYKVGSKIASQRALDMCIRDQPDEEFRQWCIQQKILLSKTTG